MTAPRGSRAGSIALLVAVGLLRTTGRASGADVAQPTADCGPAAVAVLLSVAGHPAPFDRVAASLPPRPGGHTMLELRDLAASFGLALDGRFIGKDAAAVDRPMLAYLREGSFRHFLVVRPVGPSGSLVQVIDFQQPPRVMDRAELVRSPQWTGIVLTPHARPSGVILLGAGLALSIALALGSVRSCVRPGRQ